jgi:hypothetical protein
MVSQGAGQSWVSRVGFGNHRKRDALAQLLGYAEESLNGEPVELTATKAGEVGCCLAGPGLGLAYSEPLAVEGGHDSSSHV